MCVTACCAALCMLLMCPSTKTCLLAVYGSWLRQPSHLRGSYFIKKNVPLHSLLKKKKNTWFLLNWMEAPSSVNWNGQGEWSFSHTNYSISQTWENKPSTKQTVLQHCKFLTISMPLHYWGLPFKWTFLFQIRTLHMECTCNADVPIALVMLMCQLHL